MISSHHPLFTICSLLVLLAGCATTRPDIDLPPFVEQQRINDLQLAIMALDDDIDASEARQAAVIAIEYPLQLARQYEISDTPLVHNLLVNLGVKPRGLCVHWTADLRARLQQERFHSLQLHWGIANFHSAFRIEHSSVIISARGGSLQQGLVLDPWRNSGRLFWSRTPDDPSYRWYPHAEIQALKRERRTLALNHPAER